MFGTFTLPAGTVLHSIGLPFQLVTATQIECSEGCYRSIVNAQQHATKPRDIYRPGSATDSAVAAEQGA